VGAGQASGPGGPDGLSRPDTSRVAVVTGGGSGMGRAVCHHLARRGHRVAVLDIDGAGAEQVAKEVEEDGGRALAAAVDVSDRAAVEGALDRTRNAFGGPIGILVTSAGIEGFEEFLDISTQAWERMLSVNLTGTFHCVQPAVPDMMEARWGRIVTISSSSAQSGTRRMAHYVASKGGVIALTKALALDLAPYGITVNTIPPGAIDTPMMRRPMESGQMGSMEQIVARAPLGRLGTPDDIAATCAFLCSEDASYITGQQINVNGLWYV
jgi:2-hydroxycyclohexanecarboxyl-CoA dehydrogenase